MIYKIHQFFYEPLIGIKVTFLVILLVRHFDGWTCFHWDDIYIIVGESFFDD